MPICHWVWRLSQRRRADLSRGTMCGSATAPDLASEPRAAAPTCLWSTACTSSWWRTTTNR